MTEEYSLESASQFIGKRVLISIRHKKAGEPDRFEAFFGTIESVHDDGYYVALEGRKTGQKWAIPPVADAFDPAEYESYEIEGENEPITDIDYISEWSGAEDISDLQ